MKKITYDLDALRSLTVGIDAGSLAKTARLFVQIDVGHQCPSEETGRSKPDN